MQERDGEKAYGWMRVMEELSRKRGCIATGGKPPSLPSCCRACCRRHDSLVTGALGITKLSTAMDQDIMGGVCPLHLDWSVIVSTFAFFSRYILSLQPCLQIPLLSIIFIRICSPLLVLRLTASSTRVDTITST